SADPLGQRVDALKSSEHTRANLTNNVRVDLVEDGHDLGLSHDPAFPVRIRRAFNLLLETDDVANRETEQEAKQRDLADVARVCLRQGGAIHDRAPHIAIDWSERELGWGLTLNHD